MDCRAVAPTGEVVGAGTPPVDKNDTPLLIACHEHFPDRQYRLLKASLQSFTSHRVACMRERGGRPRSCC